MVCTTYTVCIDKCYCTIAYIPYVIHLYRYIDIDIFIVYVSDVY